MSSRWYNLGRGGSLQTGQVADASSWAASGFCTGKHGAVAKWHFLPGASGPKSVSNGHDPRPRPWVLGCPPPASHPPAKRVSVGAWNHMGAKGAEEDEAFLLSHQ